MFFLNKKFLTDLLFPKFCLACGKEGAYLCQDCKSIIATSGHHQKQKIKYLDDLYFTNSYSVPLVRKMIQKFKYEPFARELAADLASLIVDHFHLIEYTNNFPGFILVPIPLEKTRIKWRGFNQAEEISKELSKYFEIPLIADALIKVKKAPPQADLPAGEREKNIVKSFLCQNRKIVENKKILLIDDVYTTGATLREAARTLREAGAKKIIGVVVARTEPGKSSI